MKHIVQSDVTKLLLYAVSCFLLAALVTPWLYNAGMFLAEFTEDGGPNAFFEWLGGKARDAEYATFFKRALLLSALLLLPPFLFLLRMSNSNKVRHNSPWSLYLPDHAVAPALGQPLTNPRLGWTHLPAGFFIAGGLLFAMGVGLVSAGWFIWVENIDWPRALKRSTSPAISASLIEEFIFRGALLGIFLRSFRPSWAIILLSIFFAALHFLQPPDDIALFVQPDGPIPDGQVYINPESSTAGFALLKLIGLRFLDPLPFLYEFTTLLVVGLILGYARFGTASLWLPIGLHAGWVFAYKLFRSIAVRNPDLDPSLDFLIGHDLAEGLVPLGTLAVTAVVVCLFVRMVRPGVQTAESTPAEEHPPPAKEPA